MSDICAFLGGDNYLPCANYTKTVFSVGVNFICWGPHIKERTSAYETPQASITVQIAGDDYATLKIRGNKWVH